MSQDNTPPAGLVNLGNTCYLNSAIQSLLALDVLAGYLVLDVYQEEVNIYNTFGTRGKLVDGIATLFKMLNDARGSVVNPKQLKLEMDEFAPYFSGYDQQDAQEFLSFLLDGIHEDVNRVNIKKTEEEPTITRATFQRTREEVVAAAAWKRHLGRNKSFIVDLFQGQLRSAISCLTCGIESFRYDPFMYLSLPLKYTTGSHTPSTATSLYESLHAFTVKEHLGADNLWGCPKCKCPVQATKQLSLLKVPPILVVHLKRFEFHEGEFVKIEGLVDAPLKGLNLNQTIKQKDEFFYTLKAVIDHRGRAQYGHYTASVLDSTDRKWYHYDDSSVTHIQPEEVIRPHNYVLFYVRDDIVFQPYDVKLVRKQSYTKPADWPHLVRTASLDEFRRQNQF